MLKKCLFAIAVIALLAVTVQGASIKYKGDPYPWPVKWEKIEICQIDIFMEVGFWVELKGCGDDAQIVLKQVPCSDVGQEDDAYPCYKGCTDLEIRTNFEAELDGDVSHDIGMSHKQKFNGDSKLTLVGDGKWDDVEACVLAYKVKLWEYKFAAGEKAKVGTLKVRIIPKLDIDLIYPPMPTP